MIRKKWYVIGLALVLTFTGTACGSIKEKAAAIKKLTAGEEVISSIGKMKRADSLAADITVDLELSVWGQSFDAGISADMKYQQEPKLLYDEISVDMGLLGTQESEIYVKEEEDAYVVYSKDTQGWIKSEQPKADTTPYSIKDGLEFYLKNVEALTKEESETINGSKADKYEGVLRGDAVYDLMKQLNLFDQIEKGGSGLVIEESMFQDLDDIPVELWIGHQSGCLLQGKMDMTNAAKTLLENITSQMTGITGSIAQELTVETIKISLECSDYNELTPIVIPQEAAQAPADN